MYENRIRHLEEMHQILDKKIDAVEKTGAFEDTHLTEMKKQRLHIRDEISKLKHRQAEHDKQAKPED
jgi:hypothetical protein